MGWSLARVLGMAAHYGLGQSLLGFVIGHGVIELSVIFIAGGAGLQLGWALLNPGRYTRRDSLAIAARRAVMLVLSAIPLLVIAGLIEGLFSPSDAPFEAHVLVGVTTPVLRLPDLHRPGAPYTRPMARRPAAPHWTA
jgi:uncharacterized membrane protein SpoIIM required for sporulation